jgi:hypothetical protein
MSKKRDASSSSSVVSSAKNAKLAKAATATTTADEIAAVLDKIEASVLSCSSAVPRYTSRLNALPNDVLLFMTQCRGGGDLLVSLLDPDALSRERAIEFLRYLPKATVELLKSYVDYENTHYLFDILAFAGHVDLDVLARVMTTGAGNSFGDLMPAFPRDAYSITMLLNRIFALGIGNHNPERLTECLDTAFRRGVSLTVDHIAHTRCPPGGPTFYQELIYETVLCNTGAPVSTWSICLSKWRWLIAHKFDRNGTIDLSSPGGGSSVNYTLWTYIHHVLSTNPTHREMLVYGTHPSLADIFRLLLSYFNCTEEDMDKMLSIKGRFPTVINDLFARKKKGTQLEASLIGIGRAKPK